MNNIELIQFIKTNGQNFDGTDIYHFKDNKVFPHNNNIFDALFMGIYNTLEQIPKEVVQFLAIELDKETLEDTTHEVFFDWDELPHDIQMAIMNEIQTYSLN